MGVGDELGTFIFRTPGYNSIRTLAARLHYFKAVSGDLLACLPLELRLRGKSTAQSRGTPIYYVDLTIRDGLTLEEVLTQAQQTYLQREAMAYTQQALDAVARAGLGNGAFEEDLDEAQDVIEEFFPGSPVKTIETAGKSSLNEKLARMTTNTDVVLN